ncbi:MAG TPA: thiolase family protein [Planktothrix sp.]|jgi:acetyl-CoA C-acetyltransferase
MTSGKKKVWLVNGSRTPIGSFGKSLRGVTVDKLLRHVLKHSMRRANVKPTQIDEVVVGHGFQSGYTPNTARHAWLEEGLPPTVPGMTVSRQCGSGMEALAVATDKIREGHGDIMIAGGCESMSTVPYMHPGKLRWDNWQNFVEKKLGIPRMGPRINSAAKPALIGVVTLLLGIIAGFFYYPVALAFFAATLISAGLTVFGLYNEKADNGIAPLSLLKDMKTVNMSATAQRVADQFDISRQAQDEYALLSQQRANAATKSGRFALEIDPIEVPNRGFFSKDEHPRETSLEKLSKLRGVLGNRSITAGNSSGINDGACALVLASDDKVKELGLEPLAEIVDTAVAGVDPNTMGLGPVAAINKLLERNGLTIADVDLIEINEAFAAQYLGCEKLLGLDREKVNVNGGAIALGHPIGMSGARVALTLAHELKLRGKKRGIAALCIGGGMGIATLIERN